MIRRGRGRSGGVSRVLPAGLCVASLLLSSTGFGGCGGGTAAAPPVDGGHGIDAVNERSVVDAQGLGGYCSATCGPVSGPDDGVFKCPAGEMCGQTGGVSGFVCCNPAGICMSGSPALGAKCP
jgi:hypothetical protein